MWWGIDEYEDIKAFLKLWVFPRSMVVSIIMKKVTGREERLTRSPTITMTEPKNSSAEMGQPVWRTTVSATLHQSCLCGEVATLELLWVKGSLVWSDNNLIFWVELKAQGKQQPLVITWLIPTLQWSIVVAASCDGGCFSVARTWRLIRIDRMNATKSRDLWRKPAPKYRQPETGGVVHLWHWL